jgi:hypothetical protein
MGHLIMRRMGRLIMRRALDSLGVTRALFVA